MKTRNSLHESLQYLAGSLKAPLASALRKDTAHLRSAAKEIARIADVSERTAANYLSGVTEMPVSIAVKLAAVFGTVHALLSQAMTPPSEQSLQARMAALESAYADLQARYEREFHHGSTVRPLDVAVPYANRGGEPLPGAMVGADQQPRP